MDIKITQKQDSELLKEHAINSFNYRLFKKYEWILASLFLLIGFFIIIKYNSYKFAGITAIIIGVIELIKYPNRINRWVNKKQKENIYNKEIYFSIRDKEFEVAYDEITKIFNYQNMKGILILKSGILLKIHNLEYYYISFSSLNSNEAKEILINFIKEKVKNS